MAFVEFYKYVHKCSIECIIEFSTQELGEFTKTNHPSLIHIKIKPHYQKWN
jgi:hypothetical protein